MANEVKLTITAIKGDVTSFTDGQGKTKYSQEVTANGKTYKCNGETNPLPIEVGKEYEFNLYPSKSDKYPDNLWIKTQKTGGFGGKGFTANPNTHYQNAYLKSLELAIQMAAFTPAQREEVSGIAKGLFDGMKLIQAPATATPKAVEPETKKAEAQKLEEIQDDDLPF